MFETCDRCSAQNVLKGKKTRCYRCGLTIWKIYSSYAKENTDIDFMDESNTIDLSTSEKMKC